MDYAKELKHKYNKEINTINIAAPYHYWVRLLNTAGVKRDQLDFYAICTQNTNHMLSLQYYVKYYHGILLYL